MQVITTVFLIAHATPGWVFPGYIGPGLGAGQIAVLLGLAVAVGLAIFGVAYYPLKRLLGGNRREDAQSGAAGESDRSPPGR